MSDQYRFQIVPDLNVVFVKHFNEINLSSILERARAINSHPDSGPRLARVVDCRNINIALSAEDIKATADWIISQRETRDRYTEVLIVTGLLSQGFSRMLLALLDGIDIRYEILQDNDPDLVNKVKEIIELPSDFKFPDFLGDPFRSS
ncbi:hypothetical protein GUA87_12080 [Sneathiella sp. P13V-1]|uniref:hypothetical protein n=1 Tax=Sneathiella sp. P13V-1 TaxID=2697366 RepID=UPI00187B57DA|nr:hypothetical protein [Sneathiella sp. P13V-1]MBE7637587.1 hypothetical protein [Sneathiella sp. P13V-1]